MRTQRLGRSDLVVSRLAYGCMRYVKTWSPADVGPDQVANARACVEAALDAGYTLFDHADIYCATACESVFGDWLAENRRLRDGLVIATKCGVVFGKGGGPGRYDLSADHIERSAEASLKRLKIDAIDLYQLHRPDLLLDVAEAAAAFDRLRRAGKVRYFGVSNFRPSLFTALDRACRDVGIDLIVNQIELHAADAGMLTDGVLDQCQELNVTPLAWSPLAGGRLGDEADDEKLTGLHAALDKAATEAGALRSNVALAYLLKHPAGVVPIIGTARPDRVTAQAAAAEVELTREQWYAIHLAARGSKLP